MPRPAGVDHRTAERDRRQPFRTHRPQARTEHPHKEHEQHGGDQQRHNSGEDLAFISVVAGDPSSRKSLERFLAGGFATRVRRLRHIAPSNHRHLPLKVTHMAETTGNEHWPHGLQAFELSIDRIEDPKGDRVKVTYNGKFLPYRKW